MPASFLTLFPPVLAALETMKIPVQAGVNMAELSSLFLSSGLDWMKYSNDVGVKAMQDAVSPFLPDDQAPAVQLLRIYREGAGDLMDFLENHLSANLTHFHRERMGELAFLELFTENLPHQDWQVAYDDTRIILDLPSLRVIDISLDVKHAIHNYAVVFAPRAGHHSNIAERVALFMRDQGLTRMAVVEQKCAQDIPLRVNGARHYEGFDGQLKQYRAVLEHLAGLTGHPPHLVAICQPGPLLMSTLILNPHLGKTFGSAGAPMHMEAERGYLTDFARLAGEGYADRLLSIFGHTIPDDHPGAGRKTYDGRLQVLGFYLLGMDQHLRNFRRLLADLRAGKTEDAERQRVFYQWYNYVHHSPAGFVRDTFQKIFIRNDLINGRLTLGGKTIGIKDYPASVPIWALGGTKDDITPPLQATGHMDLIDSVPPENRLTLLCEGGHMGLFRSRKILKNHYSRIVAFILEHSDRAGG